MAIAVWPWLTCSTPWWVALTALTQASGALQLSSFSVRLTERRLPCLMSVQIVRPIVFTQQDAKRSTCVQVDGLPCKSCIVTINTVPKHDYMVGLSKVACTQ